MATFVKDKEFQKLTEKAANYDKIVTSIVQRSEGVTQEEITPQMIIDALNESTDNSDLLTQVSALTNSIAELESENTDLLSQVEALQGSPAEDPGDISSEDEASAKSETLAQFADKNKGDTSAIINAAVESGFLPKTQ